MGGNSNKKKDKKSSSSSEDDGCTNCTKLAELIETYSKTIESLTARIEALESLLKKQQNQPELSDQATIDRIRATEEMVEERTNRQLRKTLVIRGVPEQQHEKWSDTDSTLSSIIAKTMNIPLQEAESMIDRCHRGGNPKYYKDTNKHRPIYAAMHRWKDCEKFIWEARKKRSVLVDYKYGPMTTVRRNMALKKRREILDSTLVTKAHVAYPARLMGKSPGDVKYKLIEDFSRSEVKFKT